MRICHFHMFSSTSGIAPVEPFEFFLLFFMACSMSAQEIRLFASTNSFARTNNCTSCSSLKSDILVQFLDLRHCVVKPDSYTTQVICRFAIWVCAESESDSGLITSKTKLDILFYIEMDKLLITRRLPRYSVQILIYCPSPSCDEYFPFTFPHHCSVLFLVFSSL